MIGSGATLLAYAMSFTSELTRRVVTFTDVTTASRASHGEVSGLAAVPLRYLPKPSR